MVGMDNISSEEVIFTVGEDFNSFSELNDKIVTSIGTFQKTNFVQLYIRRSRSIEAGAKRARRNDSKENLSIWKLNTLVFTEERISKALAQAKDQIKGRPL